MAKAPAPVVRMPWDAVDLTPSEAASVRAVSEGVADEVQQKLAWRVIREKICNVDALSFTFAPDGQRVGDFAEGKRWVAKTMTLFATMPIKPNSRGAPPATPVPE
ncbi:MAG: hypothetical protein V4673_14520 [Pseudomonadota bacterium]